MSRERIIVECEPDNLLLAARAAKWLLAKPITQKDAILAYGEGKQEVAFYVKRNKASISVLQNTRSPQATETEDGDR